jgi:hypothetical protein
MKLTQISFRAQLANLVHLDSQEALETKVTWEVRDLKVHKDNK